MTTLEVQLDLPDRLAREAQAAGLLTPRALSRLLMDAMRRRAAQSLLTSTACSQGQHGRMSRTAVPKAMPAVRRTEGSPASRPRLTADTNVPVSARAAAPAKRAAHAAP